MAAVPFRSPSPTAAASCVSPSVRVWAMVPSSAVSTAGRTAAMSVPSRSSRPAAVPATTAVRSVTVWTIWSRMSALVAPCQVVRVFRGSMTSSISGIVPARISTPWRMAATWRNQSMNPAALKGVGRLSRTPLTASSWALAWEMALGSLSPSGPGSPSPPSSGGGPSPPADGAPPVLSVKQLKSIRVKRWIALRAARPFSRASASRPLTSD